ncbi:MAG: hypothetical protein QM617_09115 [Comamonas sp.]
MSIVTRQSKRGVTIKATGKDALAMLQALAPRGKAVKTIHFQDHGQDFLEWDLDSVGHVVGCRPFQADVWMRHTVFNFADLAPGSYAEITVDGKQTPIKYPIVKVSTP